MKLFHLALLLSATTIGGCVAGTGKAHAQAAPFVPDFAFGKTPGMIAVRGPVRWQAIPAGAAGQVLASQGSASVPNWITPSGTGNVQTSGTATAGNYPYFANGTTLAFDPAGNTALDRLLGYINNTTVLGFMRRTGAAAYSFAPIGSADLPAFTGLDCVAAAGTAVIDCTKEYANPHTWANAQTFSGAMLTANALMFNQATQAGFNQEINGQIVDFGVNYSQANGFGGTQYDNTKYGAFFRVDTRAGSTPVLQLYTQIPGQGQVLSFAVSTAGALTTPSLTPTTPVAVAYGGTGQTTGGGAALDAVSGLTANGILQRTGTGAYAANSLSQYFDAYISGAQGSIAYRGASGWTGLAPGNAGQFLAANGTGANVSWASPATPPAGNRVLIGTTTANNTAATLTDSTSFTATYAEYEIDMENITPATNGPTCTMRFLGSGGAALTAASYNQSFTQINTNSTSASTLNTLNAAQINISGTDGISNLGPGIRGIFHLSDPSVSQKPMIDAHYGYYASGNGLYTMQGHAAYLVATVVTGYQLTCSSNIASGKIKVYGWN